EMDEGMVKLGLQAAAARVPFLPTRAGLGSDVLNFWEGELRTVRSPYPDADGRTETLVAMPALNLDATFVHLDLGDEHGNAAYTGIDPYMDDLFCMSARRRYLSVDRVVSTDELVKSVPAQSIILNRMMVDGVVEAPNGAHHTFSGSYGRDEKFQRHYVESAKDPQVWAAFKARYLDVSEDEYQSAIAEFAAQEAK
ncbi:MAG: acyl CoA--acetate/3-ketoacid CoA transferase subunit alpha, partial [Nocardia sp.]|nr:acyl CoA--acetate/3-ketoacid CoA transferase subunit alpha [Nocardia sp.]